MRSSAPRFLGPESTTGESSTQPAARRLRGRLGHRLTVFAQAFDMSLNRLLDQLLYLFSCVSGGDATGQVGDPRTPALFACS